MMPSSRIRRPFHREKATRSSKLLLLAGLAAVLLLLAACGNGDGTPTTAAPPDQATPTLALDTPTSPPPTPTPQPLAGTVNGEGITLEEYEAELERARAAAGTDLATDLEKRVMDELVDQVLLAQAAAEAGFVLDEAGLQARYDALVADMGGTEAMNSWMAANGYTEESFRKALLRSAMAAWMRDKIASEVPQTAEQAHARQILVNSLDEANSILNQVRAGANFERLAKDYDPVAGGDLGWFPRGYLTQPSLEEAAFALGPDGVSDVIETPLGFHILQVIEHDPQRLLDPEAKLVLQTAHIQAWLMERRNQSEILIEIP